MSKIPSEEIKLPSRGLLYAQDSALRSGVIELRYPTARDEDILTNPNYIKDGTVLQRFFKSLIVTPNVKYEELLPGDENAIMISARIMAYGKNYSFTRKKGKDVKIVDVDLSTLKEKSINYEILEKYNNDFPFNCPNSGTALTFKLLSIKDEEAIEKEVEKLKTISEALVSPSEIRWRYIITSVNGSTDQASIIDFIRNSFLTLDTRELRKYMREIEPNVDFLVKDGEEVVDMPLGAAFFWPETQV